MSKRWLTACLVTAGLLATLAAAPAPVGAAPRVDIWTDRGEGGVYHPGESIRIHLRPYQDCYVMVYEIDTDGYLRVLYPRDCCEDGYLEGGATYVIGSSRRLYVTGPSGVDYIHVLASYEPFRQVYWHGCAGYEDYAYGVTWQGFHDYWGCALPPRINGDPYIAMETIDEFICMDGLERGLVAADLTYFYVGERVHYPRYLCYDCHGFNTCIRPYNDVCLAFSISFVDCDPCYRPCSWWWWCSPRRLYCGPRFVCHMNSGHRCSDKCNAYPSEYKWKSRYESQGTAAIERFRAQSTDPTKPTVIRGGNIIDATRYKSNEASGGQRSLYARDQARQVERSEVRKDVQKDDRKNLQQDVRGEVRKDVQKDAGDRVSGLREVARKVLKASESRGERQKAEQQQSREAPEVRKSSSKSSDNSKAKSVISSIVRTVTRSSKSSAADKPKGTNPQVRKGDKGKSQATRRTLSR
jgi:hypothetical protein